MAYQLSFDVQDDSDSIILLSKKPLGHTANLFTDQLFCASPYHHVLSPFKFCCVTISNMYIFINFFDRLVAQ